MAKQSAPVDPHRQFIKTLEDMAYSRSIGDRFSDFLELAYCAVAKQMTSGDAANRLEERYMLTIKRHRHEDIQRMPELLSLTQRAVGQGRCDFLGKISSELSILNPQIGQFFTPYDMCRMMAEVMLADVGEKISQDGFVTISEPASGSGAMILAAADVIEKQGFDPSISMYVDANDLSDAAYKMSYLQLSARGIQPEYGV